MMTLSIQPGATTTASALKSGSASAVVSDASNTFATVLEEASAAQPSALQSKSLGDEEAGSPADVPVPADGSSSSSSPAESLGAATASNAAMAAAHPTSGAFLPGQAMVGTATDSAEPSSTVQSASSSDQVLSTSSKSNLQQQLIPSLQAQNTPLVTKVTVQVSDSAVNRPSANVASAAATADYSGSETSDVAATAGTPPSANAASAQASSTEADNSGASPQELAVTATSQDMTSQAVQPSPQHIALASKTASHQAAAASTLSGSTSRAQLTHKDRTAASSASDQENAANQTIAQPLSNVTPTAALPVQISANTTDPAVSSPATHAAGSPADGSTIAKAQVATPHVPSRSDSVLDASATAPSSPSAVTSSQPSTSADLISVHPDAGHQGAAATGSIASPSNTTAAGVSAGSNSHPSVVSSMATPTAASLLPAAARSGYGAGALEVQSYESSSPNRLEVGLSDGASGWLRVRAELTTDGSVHAALSSSSTATESALRSDVHALAGYLSSQQLPVHRVEVVSSTAQTWTTGGDGGMQGQSGGSNSGPSNQSSTSESTGSASSSAQVDAEPNDVSSTPGPSGSVIGESGNWLSIRV